MCAGNGQLIILKKVIKIFLKERISMHFANFLCFVFNADVHILPYSFCIGKGSISADLPRLESTPVKMYILRILYQ